jgi:hypothetical protein
MKDKISTAIMFVLTVIVAYHGVMFLIWQANNPKANQMTFYTYYSDMMHGRTLEQFQE